jgi:tyrosine-protein phosphatase YwqE
MSFLSDLFKKKKYKEELSPINLSEYIKVDMHSHILPGIDDGAKNIDQSIELIEGLIGLGFSQLLCTPHVMTDFYRNSTDLIKIKLDQLRNELDRRNININIRASAEYYFDEELTKRLKRNDIISFGKERYLLFEFSYLNEQQQIFEIITDMINAGYTPVLAHPERYPYYVMNSEKFRQIKSMGVKFQINLLSLTGNYGISAVKGAKYLIDENLVDFIGTDIHKNTQLEGLEHVLKNEHLHSLIKSNNLLNSSLVE